MIRPLFPRPVPVLRRLLVVDDIALVREMLRELFERAGFEVMEASGADEALALSQMVRWDGVVLDIDMPGLNGIELYARLAQYNESRRLPVLFFTGRPHAVLELSLAGTPWARLVAKPCAGLRLVALMEQCLLAAAADAVREGRV